MKQPIRYDRKQESGIRHILKKIFAIREIVILLLVLVLGVFMALTSRQFLTTANFKTIGNYMANDMIIGAFLTISLIAGNTDFSVGSNMGCSAFVCGLHSGRTVRGCCDRRAECILHRAAEGRPHDRHDGHLDGV